MKELKNIYQLEYYEYTLISIYLKLLPNKEIFDILNQRLLIFSKYKNFDKIDIFIKKISKNSLNLHYLDFFVKYFFRKSILRYQLNLILALHESNYDDFQAILSKRNIFIIFYEFLIFILIFFSFPMWLIIFSVLNCFKSKKI